MKLKSIRTKVIAAMLACLCVGLVGILLLMHYSFQKSARQQAEQTLAETHKLFDVSSANEVSKMASISELLNANPQFGEAMLAKDNFKLIGLTAQLFLKVKEDGITHWTFHLPQPEMAPFLRLHNPGKANAPLNRFLDDEVATKMTMITGVQFDGDGLALRTIAPLFAAHGEISGYVEFGEDLGQFLRKMKAQTKDDYGILLDKSALNRKDWNEWRSEAGLPDTWDGNAKTLLADSTSDSPKIINANLALADLPQQGKVLDRIHAGNAYFVRSAFPLRDASGKTIGAIYVAHDITAIYLGMQRTELTLSALAVLGGFLTTYLLILLLNKLIFQRLDRIIAIATRVVGGDFNTEIRIHSDDEVGQFELLFEQFRLVFIETLRHVPELQEK